MIGGKPESINIIPEIYARKDPRLFILSDNTGKLKYEEIIRFTQADLIEDDIALLDCYYEMFVWIGCNANNDEKVKAMLLASKFIERNNDGRSNDVSIMALTAGNEPFIFTKNFVDWEDNYFHSVKKEDPFVIQLELIKKSKASHFDKNDFFDDKFLQPNSNKFSYDELKSSIPAGVKPSAKEL